LNKIVYKATSNFDFLQSILFRAGCIALLIYLAFHYEENPPVILVISIICFLIFLFAGNDEIIIYSDKIVQIDTSIISVIFRSKGNVYEIKDIKAASLPEKTAPSFTEVGILLLLASLLPKSTRRNSQRQFYLDLKSGKTIRILSDLGQNKIEDIVKIINSLI
jgi:hypothetical protein